MEFALILTPLLVILMGIIQMGFIFNAQVTLTNAVREAARAGTIYQYDARLGTTATRKLANDQARNLAIERALKASMNLLPTGAPHFTSTIASATGPTTFSGGDLQVGYVAAAGGITANEPRVGEQLTVTATYHQDLLFPLFRAVLPHDANGRLTQVASATMVIN